MKNMIVVCVVSFFGCASCCSAAGGFGLSSGALSNSLGSLDTSSLVYSVEQALPTHGNYCGPAWSNGEWSKTNSAMAICTGSGALLDPVDEVDALCKAHDRVYCSNDAAARDLADQNLIDGLKAQKPVLKAKMGAQGCSNVPVSSSSVVDQVCNSSKWPQAVKDLCVKVRSSGAAPAAAPAKSAAAPQAAPEKQGGNGMVKLGADESSAQSKACADLRAEMAYLDAAIAGFTAKRAVYAKSKNVKAGGFKDTLKSSFDKFKK